MPTKEEILKKHEEADEWEDYNYPIFPAMEEYAKQEAFGLLNTYIKSERVKFPLDIKDGFITSDQLWEAYQESKSK